MNPKPKSSTEAWLLQFVLSQVGPFHFDKIGYKTTKTTKNHRRLFKSGVSCSISMFSWHFCKSLFHHHDLTQSPTNLYKFACVRSVGLLLVLFKQKILCVLASPLNQPVNKLFRVNINSKTRINCGYNLF